MVGVSVKGSMTLKSGRRRMGSMWRVTVSVGGVGGGKRSGPGTTRTAMMMLMTRFTLVWVVAVSAIAGVTVVVVTPPAVPTD